MTLVSTIIQDAYRESNLLAISATPTSAESIEGLRLLNRIVYSVIGDEMGEALIPIPIGTNNVTNPTWGSYSGLPIPDNSLVVLNLEQSQTVYLNPNPRDGARFAIQDKSGNLSTYNVTVNANGRSIESSSTSVLSTDSLNREWFYRADLGDWKRISSLSSGDTFPFPEKFDDLFIVALAMRLNPRHAVQADQQSVNTYTRGLRQFRAKYRQVREMGSDPALILLPGNPTAYELGDGTSTDLFNLGRPNQ